MDKHWWDGDAEERYWLEFTDRDDLGVDLRAPDADSAGRDNWRYSLFKRAAVGDVVFHYHAPQDAILGVSRVAGKWQSRPIVWGARGTFARERGDKPHHRAGYYVPLRDYRKLPAPVTLASLREQKGRLRTLVDAIKARHPKSALYFPFELADRPLRPLQGYAFKLPALFVQTFQLDQLIDPTTEVPPTSERRQIGQAFSTSSEVRTAIERYAMAVALRAYRKDGFRVKNVCRYSPYDILATRNNDQLTVEVKGTVGDAQTVFLTRNEVDHARGNSKRSVLFVVYGIKLSRKGNRLTAAGGEVRICHPWMVDSGKLEPLQFRYFLPST